MKSCLSLSTLTVIIFLMLPAKAKTKRPLSTQANKKVLRSGNLSYCATIVINNDSSLLTSNQKQIKAQDEKELAPENLPSFPGGDYGFSHFIQSMMTYPYEARANHISGKVLVSFIIEKDGLLNEIKVLSGLGYGCDEEAVRVLASCPKWEPGMLDGKPYQGIIYHAFLF